MSANPHLKTATNGKPLMKTSLGKLFLSGSAIAFFISTVPPAFSQEPNTAGVCNTAGCQTWLRGKALYNSASGNITAGKNTERETLADEGSIPFSISVDGEMVDESGLRRRAVFGSDPNAKPIDKQRKTDRDLNAVDIQVKFDGLDQRTLLNVSTTPIRRAYKAGEIVEFLATANYPDFIERAEIRIFGAGAAGAGSLIEAIPIAVNSKGRWIIPPGAEDRFSYVLRVYDGKGRFDETDPLIIERTERSFEPATGEKAVAPGMAEDRTAVRNIPVYGGAVTVYGRGVPSGYTIEAFGEAVPVDEDDAFVVQRILPPGDHAVNVAVKGASKTGGLDFSREVTIPQNDWFYVALADMTVGRRTGGEGIETVRGEEYDKVYSKGRVAFYLKGKIKGKYLLTAAADTRHGDLRHMFKGFDARLPKELLQRIDPDEYYPVYGDESVSHEDAPTDGKFYVRLERGDSHVMWGNYKTRITGSELMRSDRSLYGASAAHRSEAVAASGERRTEVTVYAAQPDTVPQRDEFLATGGSAYFLKRQNITVSSETVTVEVRDAITGRIVERRTLRQGEDYRFDHLQGILILDRPLSSSTGTADPVRNSVLGGHKVYVVAQYEFVPLAHDADGYIYGARAQHWLTDNVRVGVTGFSEKTGTADQRSAGADVLLRHSDTTFLQGEFSRSKGPGFGVSLSTDGGLTISDEATAGRLGQTADGVSLKGQVDLRDLNADGPTGTFGGYYENKEAGFSTIIDQAAIQRRIWGAHANVEVTDVVEAKLTYDEMKDGAGQIKRAADSSLDWQFDQYWKLSFGVSYTEIMSPQATISGKPGYNGSRFEAGLRVEYKQDDDHLYYAFGQGTLRRSGDIHRNDRIGTGAEIQLTERIGAAAEVSYGTHGLGGLAALTYDPTSDDHYYLGYRLDPGRAFQLDSAHDLIGPDRGALVAGVRRRIDETTSAYAENNYDMFGRRRSLAQTYGVVYTPDATWTVNGGIEAGSVSDDTIDETTGKQRSDFERHAPSLSVGYSDKEAGISARIRGEARFEDSKDETRDRDTYLLAAGTEWKTSDNWWMLADIDAVISRGDTGAFHDGEYLEASLGYAYRPVENDRLNALFRYSYLYDLPGINQISAVTGLDAGPLQRSHILSADFTYDLFPWLSIGGKYGYRTGEVRDRKDSGDNRQNWQKSTAHLAVARADLHVVKNWDVLVEGRALHMPEATTTDYGALVAVYRHFGENFKVGVGYNFGIFSDDLRDLTLDDQGIFLNIVGKF